MIEIMLGQRIEMNPATDEWMSGDRYGEVVDINQETGKIRVRLDKSLRDIYMHPREVYRYV